MEFDNVYRENYGKVYRLCYRMVRRVEVAEELTQDTFVKVWRYRDKFRGDSAPGTWVHRIAVNVVRMHMRGQNAVSRRAIHESLDQMFTFQTSEGPWGEESLTAEAALGVPALDHVTRVDLMRAIAELPVGQRRMVILRGVLGMDQKETAEAAGITVGGVRSMFHRGRKKVKEKMMVRAKGVGA